MSIFSPNGVNSIEDKAIRNYLHELNENLTYMFNNLTPDDNNARGVPKLTLVTDGSGESSFQITVDGIQMTVASDEYVKAEIAVLEDEIALKVDKNGVVSAINISPEQIKIQAAKISLEGIVTVNSRFKIKSDGSMEAVNGKFSGTLTGSTISGSTISGTTISGSTISGSLRISCGDTLWIEETDDGYEAAIGEFSFQYDGGYNSATFASTNGRITLIKNTGIVKCYDVKFTNQSYDPDRWTLSEWLMWLYDEIESLGA